MAKRKSGKNRGLRVAIPRAQASIISHASGLFAFLKGKPKPAPIINISTTGLKLLSLDELANDTKLSLKITIPALGVVPLLAEGRVIWSKPFRSHPVYLVGVKFTELTGVSRKRLKHLIGFFGKKLPGLPKVKKGTLTTQAACPFCNTVNRFMLRGFTSPPLMGD